MSREQPDVMVYADMLNTNENAVASSTASITSGTSFSGAARNQSIDSETQHRL